MRQVDISCHPDHDHPYLVWYMDQSRIVFNRRYASIRAADQDITRWLRIGALPGLIGSATQI